MARMLLDGHLPETLLPCLDAGVLRVRIMGAAGEAWEDQQHWCISW
jgi:hypothetical protein